MIAPKNHPQERERLESLQSYSILDTLPESDYDNLTKLASEICGTPISLISLVDENRQWFKSRHGVDAKETPREQAFCAHAIHDHENVFMIQDARKDERFHDNPLVTGAPNIVFYAGVPLVGKEGLPLGTLCVIDKKPHLLSKSQLESLRALSNQVMNLLALRRNKQILEHSLKSLEEKNRELERFASIAAHDLKSPLNNISGLARLTLDDCGEEMDEDGKRNLKLILQSSTNLNDLINGLLNHSKSESLAQEEKSHIQVYDLLKRISGLFSFDNQMKLHLNTPLKEIYVNETALNQVLINLVANSVKYCDKPVAEIELGVGESKSHYEFYVKDNGPGIEVESQEGIFNIFETAAVKDKFDQTGNGIGLATVKKIVEKLGGEVSVESELGKGAKFIFTLSK